MEKDKYILTGVIKDLETKSSWLVLVSPKSSNKYPSQTHTEEKTDTAKRAMRIEVEIGVMLTQAQEYLEPPEARRRKGGFFPRALGGMWP